MPSGERAGGAEDERDRRASPIDQRVWDATLPCPNCGNTSVIGFLYLDQFGHHQHTHYVCTFWATPEDKSVYLRPGYDASKDRCGWHGWSVPGWDQEPAPSSESEPPADGSYGPDRDSR